MRKIQTEFFLKDKPVTVEKYDEMLGCLPPIRMAYGGFLVGEAYDYGKDKSGNFGARYDFFFTEGEKYYYGGLASVSDFDTFLLPGYIVKDHITGKQVLDTVFPTKESAEKEIKDYLSRMVKTKEIHNNLLFAEVITA